MWSAMWGAKSAVFVPLAERLCLLLLLQALGFTMGVFHVECKYTSRGARLIEVNARMGGGPVR
jgi:carnosine synthase